MTNDTRFKVAILYPGDAEQRKTAAPGTSRFLPVFRALADLGLQVEPVTSINCPTARRNGFPP